MKRSVTDWPALEAGTPAAETPLGPRARTLLHLKRLVALGTLGGLATAQTACPPMVCDPLPPPLECSADTTAAGMTEYVWVAANFVKEGEATVLSVVLSTSDSEEYSTSIAGDPTLSGATLGTVKMKEAQRLEFTCLPDEGGQQVLLTVPLKCGEFTIEGQFQLEWSGTAAEGTYVNVTAL